MCIRDRPLTLAVAQVVLVAAGKSRFAVPSSSVEQVLQLKPCLLYTSDAADERSSVDLGGRRIIKKKKTVRLGGVGDST